jgi:iron-sulfur cluster insertion protein
MAEGRGVPPDRQVSLTERAARRIAELKVMENTPAAFLRLAVSGGGCSGFGATTMSCSSARTCRW